MIVLHNNTISQETKHSHPGKQPKVINPNSHKTGKQPKVINPNSHKTGKQPKVINPYSHKIGKLSHTQSYSWYFLSILQLKTYLKIHSCR